MVRTKNVQIYQQVLNKLDQTSFSAVPVYAIHNKTSKKLRFVDFWEKYELKLISCGDK